MRHSKLLLRSALCGVGWGALGMALTLILLLPARGTGAGRIAWQMRGALFVSPALGLIVGLCSPVFRRGGAFMRGGIALVTLYSAGFVFLVAGLITEYPSHPVPRYHIDRIFVDAWNGVVFGMTATGFVLFLAALAYATHAWVSRGWPGPMPDPGPGLGLR